MACVGFGIGHHLVVDFLIASFAKTARVMRPVLVLALGGLLLVARVQVAMVAHELGLVSPVLMRARSKTLEALQDSLVVQYRLVITGNINLAIRIKELLNILMFPRSHCIRLSTLLHLPLLDLWLLRLLTTLRIREATLRAGILAQCAPPLHVLVNQGAYGLDVLVLRHGFGVGALIIGRFVHI